MVQAAFFDGISFDPFAFEQDGLAASEVNVGGREVVEPLVVSSVIVMFDEVRDLGFKVFLEEVVFEQDAVLQRLVPTFDLTLRLRVTGSAVDLVYLVFVQPITKVGSDVTRTVAPTEGRTGATEGAMRAAFLLQARIVRGGHGQSKYL